MRIVLEGADKFNNLIGSVHYPEGDTAVDLSLELVKQVRMNSELNGHHISPFPPHFSSIPPS